MFGKNAKNRCHQPTAGFSCCVLVPFLCEKAFRRFKAELKQTAFTRGLTFSENSSMTSLLNKIVEVSKVFCNSSLKRSSGFKANRRFIFNALVRIIIVSVVLGSLTCFSANSKRIISRLNTCHLAKNTVIYIFLLI